MTAEQPLRSRDLRPGDVIELFDTGNRHTIGERWSDSSGWWTAEGGGFSDACLDRRQWERVEP